MRNKSGLGGNSTLPSTFHLSPKLHFGEDLFRWQWLKRSKKDTKPPKDMTHTFKFIDKYSQSKWQWYEVFFPMRCFNWCALVTWASYPSIWDLKGFHSYLSYFNFWGQKIRTLIWIFFWSFSPWKCEKKLATSPPVSSSIPSGHRQFFTKCLMSKWAVPLPSPWPLITIPEL